MKRLAMGFAAAMAFALGAVAQAAPIAFFTTMTGAAEAPPNASPGTGSALVLFDLTAHTLTIDVEFLGLLGTTTAAHIHCCVAPPGNIAPATTLPFFAGFPIGVTAGSYFAVLDTTLASTFSAGFLAANGGVAGAETALLTGLLAGRAYFNVHTTRFPGGEIRGFLRVSEPGSLALFAAALLAAGWVQQRRIKR